MHGIGIQTKNQSKISLTMNTKYLFLIAFVLLLALSSFAFGQTAQPSTPTQKVLKLESVEFKGLQRLKSEQVLAQSGLQIGQIITPDIVDEAAARLNDSGLFSKLGYRFRSSGEQAFVTFNVEENRITIPVVFDNFIWFTEEEIWLGVKKDVPSFTGTIPESGDGIEQIRNSLERILKTKKIEGRVETMPYTDQSGMNPKQIFTVKGVNMTPCSMRFIGAIEISEKDLIAKSQDLLKGEYSRNFVEDFANTNLKPLYRKIGFLKAKFMEVTAKPTADDSECKGVIVTVKVEEGKAYTWNGATWGNNKGLTTLELDVALGLKQGEITDGLKIDKGLEDIKTAYSRKGFLSANFNPQEVFDDDKKNVSFHFNVSEGPQFKMGTLTIIGLPDDVIPRLQESWKIKAGEVYDSFYIKEFTDKVLVKENSLILLIRGNPKIRQYTSVKPDVKTLTVNVTIEFKE